MTSDHELMKAVREGAIDKLGNLFERHNKHLYNFFLLGTKSRDTSEDLVQEVFFRMLKYRHTYQDDGDFKVWMFRIARNARTDYYRKHSQRHDLVEDIDTFESNQPNPHEELEQESDIALLKKAITKLPEDKRELIMLSRYQNLKYREIGEILDCTEGTVKVRMYRAMKELTDIYNTISGGTIS